VAQSNPAASSGTAAAFLVSNVALAGNPYGGNVDEIAVWGVALTAAQLCKHTHCGIDGVLCMCDAATPANYRACSVDADCRVSGNTTAECDSNSNTCRGHDATCSPAACNATSP
jgi:hypothetical protein